MTKNYPTLQSKDLPPAPGWRQAVGVGVVVLGLAIGTGELILWPHLTAKYGLGVLWGALVGLTLQFFINREVARHALATGESFFLTTSRVLRYLVWVWLISATVLYIWPGWALALGSILVELTHIGTATTWSWAMLATLLIVTFVGRSAYKTLENTLKVIVPLFISLLVVVSFLNLNWIQLGEAAQGLVRFGWIPDGIDRSVFFGAIVFAGTGGLLNLCVSLWYRDKQAGMGAYMGQIKNPLTGNVDSLSAGGYKFEPNAANLKRWKAWMRYVTVDQAVVFWLLGLITLILLSLNSYAVLAPSGAVPEGFDVAVAQADIFGSRWGGWGRQAFLLMAFLMLFSVMWAIISAFTRIVTDIIHANASTGPYQRIFHRFATVSPAKLYYSLVVLMVLAQAALTPFKAPLIYLTITSVLGGFLMAFYVPLLLFVNNRRLPKAIRPGWITNAVLVFATIFYGALSVFVLLDVGA